MANPNKAVAAARAKLGKPAHVAEAMAKGRERRRQESPLSELLAKVEEGQMTWDEAKAELERLSAAGNL